MTPPSKWSTKTTIIVETVVAVLSVAALVVAVIGLLVALNASRQEQHRLQDAFCGMVTPIAQQHSVNPLGVTIINGARHAAGVIHCPR